MQSGKNNKRNTNRNDDEDKGGSSSSSYGGNLGRQRQHYDRAYSLIDKAIDLDHQLQNGSLVEVDRVKSLYTSGLEEIRLALNLNFSESDWQRAQILERKMREHSRKVEERLLELNKKYNAAIGGSSKHTTSTESLAKMPANIDPKLANWILNEILVSKPDVTWEDVAGLNQAKKLLQEVVIMPMIRPDLFTGLRTPSRGVLLFGPPGTGKTMLAKALANECNAKFFALSASSLVSKYLGESEKLVRTLFELARYIGNCVLFFDEIDSILSKRREEEHEASRRLKTEFLVQFDGIKSSSSGSEHDKILIIGATNRPEELDEAARRRFTHRIYIPLPEPETRFQLLKHLLRKQENDLKERQLKDLVACTDGYSCSDLTALAKEASLYPLRDLTPAQLKTIKPNQVRKISIGDFKSAMTRIRASVSREELRKVERWAQDFGSTLL